MSVAVRSVTIRAELVLDDEGRPVAIRSSSKTHYRIRLWLEGVPDDAHAVTWVLHETYRDPVRETLDAPDFCIELTTYGDYEVVANVRRRRMSEKYGAKLSEALAASHRSPTVEIAAAIDAIRRS
jgi:hypothetical protein